MNRYIGVICVIVLNALMVIVFQPDAVRAEVLGTATYEWTSRCNDDPEEEYIQQLQFSVYFMHCWSNYGCGTVKHCCTTWDAWLDSTHVDTVLTISSDSDSFDCFIDRLTDGVQPNTEYLFIEFIMRNPSGETYGCACGRQVDAAFSLETIDFEGATITSIKLILDALEFRDIPPSPNWRARIVIEGSWNTGVESCSWGRIKTIHRQ
jgi:hypothetical protein